MGTWFYDHILGPEDHASRPAFADVALGTVYVCTTHDLIYKADPDAGDWIVFAAVLPPGGSTGDSLVKASGSDYDLEWDAPAAAGLTDPTTTKGDLLVRGASAVGRLGVGADGTALVADAASTLGVKWDTVSGGGGGGGALGLAIGASIPGGTPAGTLIFRKAEWFASLVADSPAVLLGLDETTGNWLDQSGNARHFTPGSGVTRGKTPLVGDGLASASGDGSHSIGDLASNGGIGATGTIECWAKIPAGTFQATFAAIGTGSTGWGMQIGNGAGGAGRLFHGIAPGVNYVNCSPSFSFPTPIGSRSAIYHLALTLTSHTWTWFVNGDPVGSNTLTEITPGAGMHVGSYGGVTEFLASGIDIDNVAFFPTVLSDARIKQHAFRQPYSLLGWYDGSKLQPLGAA